MPFALLGVSRMPHPPEKLKEVMSAEQLNWRSFSDEDGEIARQWNSPPTPAYYIMDHRGIIRRQWIGSPGAATIDRALDQLIKEAQAANQD